MSRITVTQAAKDFNVSRNTLYKKIRQGLLTKDSDGRLDVNDLLRVIGSQSERTNKNVTLNKGDTTIVTDDIQLKQEIESLVR